MIKPEDVLLKNIEDKTAVVGVIGLGYVGLPLAVTVATRGFRTIGFDTDPKKLEYLNSNKSYIDAVESSTLESLSRAKAFTCTNDFETLSECDVIIICVPTPLTRYREPDLSFVEATAISISQHMTPKTLVVLESTTFPGTTEDILTPLLSKSGLKHKTDFFVGFSPEREDPGNTAYQTSTIPKVVAGSGRAAGELVKLFYSQVVDHVVPVSSTRTAEAVKISENIFRAVNIALVNELKVIYDAMGIDVWEVIDAAATKPFGFMPFYPGPGLGGHCIPIDPFYLAWKAREYDVPTRFIELAGEINTNMPLYVIARLRQLLDQSGGRGLNGSRILIVGIAYKKNVSDMRESPSMRLMKILVDEGCKVSFIDPHVSEIPPTREYPDLAGRTAIAEKDLKAEDIDAVLIATDHDAVDYALLTDLEVPILDTRNAIAKRGLPIDRVIKA